MPAAGAVVAGALPVACTASSTATPAGRSALQAWSGVVPVPDASAGLVIQVLSPLAGLVLRQASRQNFSNSATTLPGAGTYPVGFCVQNSGGGQPLSNNDYVNGWAMVTN